MAKKKKIAEKIDKKEFKENSFIRENLGIIITLSVLTVIILGAAFIYWNSNNFEYKDIKFIKQNYGNILLYTAKIPVKDYYGNIIEYRQTDFRNDPRKLYDVVSIPEDLTIKFVDTKTTYLVFKDDQVNCENYGLATANLAIFLRDVIKINYKAALANQTQAVEKNVSYITCETAPFNTVIYLHQGNESKITKRIVSCYDVEFKDCEILEAAEAFELKILEQDAERN